MSQRWLVTGCSRGLGRALAEAVLQAGHRVVATARDPAPLAELEQWRELGVSTDFPEPGRPLR